MLNTDYVYFIYLSIYKYLQTSPVRRNVMLLSERMNVSELAL